MRLDKLTEIKRLVIYFFYDADGIVDRYVPYMLEDLKKNCSEIFVVCNGKLTPEGRDVFTEITPNILVRENKGFDVWAYKVALEQYGWDELEKYDEIIMMNHTIMGPVYPFAEVFQEMDKRDVDFWGITKHHKMKYDPFGKCKYKYIPEHIQSHFIAIRKPVLKSREFKYYWKELKEITAYDEAVCYHEAIFTKTFSDAGFKWEVYTDTTDLEGFTEYPLIMAPLRLIKEYRCPIFKRRSFFQEFSYLLSQTDGGQAKALLAYLQNETNYDVGMIWENILRTSNMAAIKNCLDLNYIVPETSCGKLVVQKKLALVIHAYFDDLVDYCYNYALSMPEYSDIYITVGSQKLKEKVEKRFTGGPWNRVKIIEIENRGRDVSALLVGAAKYILDYDYVCFVHDKKVTQLDLGIKGYTFSERCFRNLLGSKELVCNIISLFEGNPYMGMLCPPPPNHADYYPILGYEWGPNFELTKKLAEELGLKCPMSLNDEPIAPLGTMFWFRSAAMRPLLEKNWKYTDFPEEPVKTDGTMLHAIERIYPFVIQNSGFYCAWVMGHSYAQTEIQNLSYMLRTLNIQATKIYGNNSHDGLVRTMNYYCQQGNFGGSAVIPERGVRLQLKQKVREKMPKPIWKAAKWLYHLFGGKKWLDETLC